MKFTKTLLATLLAISFGITSCGDDSDDDTQNPTVLPLSNEIQVDIDGETWRGDISNVAISGSLTTVTAVKANADINRLQIFLPTDSVNTFNIPTSIVTVSVRRNSNVLSNSTIGTFALSSNDSISIDGIFNCNVTSFSSNDTLLLTNGAISYDFN